MESYKNNLNIIKTIYERKVVFGIIVAAAFILSIIFSGPSFITPKFKSVAILYPANIAPYSGENETEQMLQFFHSGDFIDSLDVYFDLGNHYGLSKDKSEYKSILGFLYNENTKIAKTAYESVEVEVWDHNPEFAYKVVNKLIELYNNKVKRLHKQKYSEVVKMHNLDLKQKEHNIDSLKRVLNQLGTKYGIFNIETQGEQVTKGYLRTVSGAGASRINTQEINKLQKALETHGGNLQATADILKNEVVHYSTAVMERDRQARFLKSNLTYYNLVSSPTIADKKSYPVRWIIVAGVTVAAFFLCLVILLIIDNRKKLLKF
ncbi:MAG: hypothetical protein ACEPOW_04135 [Bacteroidales bacterium]